MIVAFTALLLGGGALLVSLATQRRVKQFLDSSKVNDLAQVLKDHHLRQAELKSLMRAMNQNQAGLNRKLRSGLRRSGFLRFNPYRDTGGDQSFCLALLDDRNDGYILTAVHGREGTRVYAKRIVKGESDYNLSVEEIKALKEALSKK